ncbi:MAG: hypothetical protein ABI665_26860 [Vicinamibacterales bacterium]
MAESIVRRSVKYVLATSAGIAGGLLLSVAVDYGTAFVQASTGELAATQASQARTFGSDAGMILNFVKADKTAEFEGVMARLKEALQHSDKPERQAQAKGWRVYKAQEPGANGTVLYIFWVNPPVKDTDYTVSMILAEVFPSEAQAIFKQYADSLAQGQNILNLSLVSALGR